VQGVGLQRYFHSNPRTFADKVPYVPKRLRKYLLVGLCILPSLFSGCAAASFDTMMVAPDTAAISIRGSYRSDAHTVAVLMFKQCAQITLQHGYRYFILSAPISTSVSHSQVVVPGSSFTNTYAHGNATAYGAGGFAYATGAGYANSNTVYSPATAVPINQISALVVIKMSNDSNSLLPFAILLPNGTYSRPKDAAFIAANNK